MTNEPAKQRARIWYRELCAGVQFPFVLEFTTSGGIQFAVASCVLWIAGSRHEFEFGWDLSYLANLYESEATETFLKTVAASQAEGVRRTILNLEEREHGRWNQKSKQRENVLGQRGKLRDVDVVAW